MINKLATDRIKLNSVFYFSKKHYHYFIIVFVMVIVSCIVSSIKNERNIRNDELAERTNIARNLVNNDMKLKFISTHLFTGENKNFDTFVREIATNDFAKISSIECIDETHLKHLRKTLVKIQGIFWHDSMIYDFLERLGDFSPGFIKILSVDIDKFSRVTTFRPVIKVDIECEIFQK